MIVFVFFFLSGVFTPSGVIRQPNKDTNDLPITHLKGLILSYGLSKRAKNLM